MSETSVLVVLLAVEAGRDEQFNQHHDAHVAEMLEVPGFTAAQRFRRSGTQLPGHATEALGYGYLAIYEIEGSPEAAITELLARHRAGRYDEYRRNMAGTLLGTQSTCWTPQGEVDGSFEGATGRLLDLLSVADADDDAADDADAWRRDEERRRRALSTLPGVTALQGFAASSFQVPSAASRRSDHRLMGLCAVREPVRATRDALAALPSGDGVAGTARHSVFYEAVTERRGTCAAGSAVRGTARA